MSVVFGLADRISVLVYGADHRLAARRTRSAAIRRCKEAYLGEEAA